MAAADTFARFNRADVPVYAFPAPNDRVVSYGNPSELFISDKSTNIYEIRCRDRSRSTKWYHGRDKETGGVGWVSACDLEIYK